MKGIIGISFQDHTLIKLRFALALLIELVLIVALLAFVFRSGPIDLSVPLNYWGDTLWFTTVIKGMVDNGWTYVIPQLSAPFELSAIDFPTATHFDWIIMKGISLFTDNPGKIVNIFWVITIIFSAWTATMALRLLGVGYLFALPAAVAYGLLPYAFWRNVAHINLVYYTVPLICLLAIYLATGSEQRNRKIIERLGYAAAIIQGLNYIYFSFFSVIILIFGGMAGFFRRHSARSIRVGAAAAGIIIISTALNLAPSILSWVEHGKPDIGIKSPYEAEYYGLRIRQMLVPHRENPLPWLSKWAADNAAAFPVMDENAMVRLGPLAGLGFLLSILAVLGFNKPNSAPELTLVQTISLFVILTVLISTVGGLGVIFNLLVAPDIRCYNRFSVFIAFFALASVSLYFQYLSGMSRLSYRKLLVTLGFAVFAGFSIYDQLLDAKPLVARRAADITANHIERSLVQGIEARFPVGTQIFQLPVTEFPLDHLNGRMLPYDHARPYLSSKAIRWSWPSFSLIDKAWLQRITNLPETQLLENLVLAGFGVVWIDRYGYSDNGVGLVKSLVEAGASQVLSSTDNRYVVLDLSAVADRLRDKQAAHLRDAPFLEWGSGFYGEERMEGTGILFRWSRATSLLLLHNPTATDVRVLLRFTVVSWQKGNLSIRFSRERKIIALDEGKASVELKVDIPANSSTEVELVGDMGRITLPPGETRDLHFMVVDANLERIVSNSVPQM